MRILKHAHSILSTIYNNKYWFLGCFVMYKIYKRLFDVILSLSALVFFAPFFVIVIVAIKISDRGPVFFVQKRVGLCGKLFEFYKFRSMYFNTTGSFYTEMNDKRITPIGKYLRKFSIDELPQLINVIKGDMSLVGPRPDVPQQQQDYTAEQRQKRQSVLPGITGLAQSKLRSKATFDQRIAMDIEYAETCSFFLDLKIIWFTIQSLFKDQGN